MNSEEYGSLANLEQEHWFYRGKREAVRLWIQRMIEPTSGMLLADVGAGTGLFAEEMRAICRVVAVDDHAESLALMRKRLKPEEIREAVGTRLPFSDGEVDMITALDVLEHIEHDHAALAEIHRALHPQGRLFLTVPAMRSLWSDWDVSLHHFRRYERAGLIAKLSEAGFHVEECRYVNATILPLVWLARKWRAFWPAKQRAEDQLPPHWINQMLRKWYVMEATHPRAGFFPFGVGLLAVAKKA